MNISALDNLNKTALPGKNPQEVMRQTAQQFEAILLMQLTSAMNPKTDDESGEDSLFSGDGGTNLAKQMFSEQLATTMSQSGGVGLADLIVQKMGGSPAKAVSGRNNKLSNAITAMKDIKEDRENPVVRNINRKNEFIPPIKKGEFAPSESNEFMTTENSPFMPSIEASDKSVSAGANSGDDSGSNLEIISTYSDKSSNEKDTESYQPLMLDGKILNSTRPRRVPQYALAESAPVSSNPVAAADNAATPARSAERVVFQMPVKGRISSDFGSRFHPIDKKVKFHGGLDIAVPPGTAIGAAASGVVKFAGWKGGYGNAVIIEHPDGTETLYGHNQTLLVTEGQQVSAGEKISLSGSTGKSTGPHLHFEIRENGHPVNPRIFLSNVLSKPADR